MNAPKYAVGNMFRRNNFDHEVMSRDGDVAVLKKTHQGHTSWEVVRIQRHEGFTAFGRDIPPGEYMPSGEQWGTYGWSYTSREEADAKAASLIAGDR